MNQQPTDAKVSQSGTTVLRFDVIAARLIDERPMPVRERGPLFIIYPFDSRPELKAEKYYARSAWQLRRLEVR